MTRALSVQLCLSDLTLKWPLRLFIPDGPMLVFLHHARSVYLVGLLSDHQTVMADPK